MKLYLPDFLIIGAPRCGTTWVRHNLNSHPDVHCARLPEKLESNFWNELYLPEWNFPRYSEMLKSDKKIIGEKVALYAAIAKEHLELIAKIIPNVKIIYMIRNPIEQQWSFQLHHLEMNGLNHDSIHEYLYEFFDA